MNTNTRITVLICISFAVRLFLSLFLDFEADQLQIYRQGLEFYLHGVLSPHGAAVVYTGTAIPGALQSLLAGLPLFISGGLPWGGALFLGLINSLGVWMIFELMSRIFPKLDRLDLAVYILFAPWTLVFNGMWNPSYLPIFSVGFFWQLKRSQEFLPALLMGLCMIASLQLHLSFILLPITLTLLVLLKHVRVPNVSGLGLGLLLGSLTLIPYFAAPAMNSPSPTKPSLLNNLQFHREHLEQWPAFFLRFLSFSTSETTRFIGKFHGLTGTLEYLRGHPLWIPLAILALGGSIALIGLSLAFYVHPKSWKSGSAKNPSELQMLTVVSLILPILTGLLFTFSVTGPSAHTFWILLPLSFLPTLWAINEWKLLETSIFRKFWYGYCLLGPLFSVGTFLAVERQSLIQGEIYGSQVFQKKITLDQVPPEYHPFVGEVLRALNQ